MTFLDSAIIIYLVEQPPLWGSVASQRVKELESAGEIFAVSELVRFECIVGPVKANDQTRVAAFDAFFSAGLHVSSISRPICDRAAQIRATFRFKPLDSLHLATAVELGCQRFLTSDQDLAKFDGLQIEVIGIP